MPLANAPAILNLLDGPVDVDPAFYVVWSRFRMMRRYLAYCPEEESRIFRMLDLISRGAQGHGPVHLLLISAAELGFAWDGGWLPGLKGIGQRDPWALSFGNLASFHLERCLVAYPIDFGNAWTPPDCWDVADIALEMPEYPNVWTDGSREDFSYIGWF